MTYQVCPADLAGLEPAIPGLIGDIRSDHAGETGANAVYATIAAVETFVVRHYAEQIAKLPLEGAGAELRAALAACQEDEGQHRDEARRLQTAPASRVLRAWTWIVALGSQAAVIAARRI